MNTPPPYPPPPPPPPGPKNKLLLVFGGVLAAVLLVGALVGLLTSSSSPSSVTESFLEAARNGDTAKAQSLTCAGHDLGEDLTIPKDEGEVSWKLSDEQVTGDTARVTVAITLAKDGNSLTRTGLAQLQKQNGEWKLCDIDDKD